MCGLHPTLETTGNLKHIFLCDQIPQKSHVENRSAEPQVSQIVKATSGMMLEPMNILGSSNGGTVPFKAIFNLFSGDIPLHGRCLNPQSHGGHYCSPTNWRMFTKNQATIPAIVRERSSWARACKQIYGGFLSHRGTVPPSSHPLLVGILHEITIQLWGYPIFGNPMKPPFEKVGSDSRKLWWSSSDHDFIMIWLVV